MPTSGPQLDWQESRVESLCLPLRVTMDDLAPGLIPEMSSHLTERVVLDGA